MNPLILNPTKSLILLSFSLLLIFLGQFSRLTNCPKKWDHCHLCILLQIKHSVLLRIFALKFFAKDYLEVIRCCNSKNNRHYSNLSILSIVLLINIFTSYSSCPTKSVLFLCTEVEILPRIPYF